MTCIPMFQRICTVSPAIIAAACLATASAQPDSDTPRSFTAGFGSVSLDLRTNQSVYTEVEITDGFTTVRAGEGRTNAASLEDSHWAFSGGVTIEFESARLSAAEASFEFEDGELLLGELDGDPVEITDFLEERNTQVRGTAERIVLDQRLKTAALYGRATLALGANEYSGCDLIYHLGEKTFNSGASDCRVELTIFPDQADDSTGPALNTAP